MSFNITLSNILDMFLMAELDVVASPIHLNIAYHIIIGESIMICIDLKVVRHINKTILENLTTLVVTKEGQDKVNMFDLNVRKDEFRLILYGEFEVV